MGEVGRGEVTQGLVGDSKELSFHFQYNGKPLGGCKQGDDKTHSAILIYNLK